ncbi:phosphonate ABC transporter substrate-binding protein [Salinarimonas ramus]|uniref:Phosphonate ABC transporter substrate-binding protein n=1 Tax=Salinarimonas ramus TaxID=690164 RepID=A0A917Q9N2_9HYPH|nr:phosphonate ABC transporter substrate-binding protein [Salinarimonas ramus]GGK38087.1 phosphonate ABC transporter substrate-binding protein [Salinarimonas ramus]
MAKYMLVLAAAAAASSALVAVPAAADWREELGSYNIGLLGGENEADRLRRYQCLDDLLTERLGVPVELFPASDYAGVMQGLVAGQLHMASLGASGYAGIHLQDPDAVEPVFTTAQVDGSLGYYSVMIVRADSGIESLEDMQGRSLAYADPNSTSGYLVPRNELAAQGIEDAYFSRTGFGGGHEQAIVAVLNGQYDAGVTWISGQGERAEGYTRGNLRRMVDNGLLDMDDVRIVWQSSIIPNGPIVVRKDLPQEAREIVVDLYGTMHETHPECFAEVAGGEAAGFEPIDHSFYEQTIEMRRREIAQSR